MWVKTTINLLTKMKYILYILKIIRRLISNYVTEPLLIIKGQIIAFILLNPIKLGIHPGNICKQCLLTIVPDDYLALLFWFRYFCTGMYDSRYK